jgi:hypothetical protein
MISIADRLSNSVSRLLDIPTFLIEPRVAVGKLFGSNYRVGKGIVAGAAYFVLGLAAFYSAGSSRDLEFKHLTYMIEGTAVRWVLYGLFMHFFVLAWGGRKGFGRTIDAYAYTIGILQPVLAFVIFALTFIYPTDYKWEIGGGRMVGGSGGAFILATLIFKGLAPTGVLLFHMIGSILICFYMSPAFSVAHGIRLWRGIGATATSVAFFLVIYIIILAFGSLAGMISPTTLRFFYGM